MLRQIAFTMALLVLSQGALLPAAGLRCEQIEDLSTCFLMPGCIASTSPHCVGKALGVPRYLREYSEQRPGIALDELVQSEGLYNIANRGSSQAHLPQAYGYKLNLAESKELEAALSHLGLANEDLRNLPSAFWLLANRKAILALSQENMIPMKRLLRIPPAYLGAALDSGYTPLQDPTLGITKEWMLTGNHSKILLYSKSGLLELIEEGITPAQLVDNDVSDVTIHYASEIAACIKKQGFSWDWMVRVDIGALGLVLQNCESLATVAHTLSIPVDALPTSYPGLRYLVENPNLPALHALMTAFSLPLAYLAEYEMAREDLSAIRKTIHKFHLEPLDAILIDPKWNQVSEAQVQHWAHAAGLDKREIMSIDPSYFRTTSPFSNIANFLSMFREPDDEELVLVEPPIISAHRKWRLSLEEIVENGLLNLKKPAVFSELLQLWRANTKTPLESFTIEFFKRLSEDAEAYSRFTNEWQRSRGLLSIDQVVNGIQMQDTVSQTNGRMLRNAILMGDAKQVEALPFLKDAASVFDPVMGLPYVFAKELGYDDIASILKANTPNTIRVDAVYRRTTECAVKKGAFDVPPESWYDKCSLYEPTDLRYPEKVGRLIESQASFWKKSGLTHVGLKPGYDVGKALSLYKTSGYIQMHEFTGTNATQALPFRSAEDLARSVNAVNFSVLLVPKANFNLRVFRGQSCDKEKVLSPSRFWSTSASADFARSWPRGACVLDLRIPKGFPAFFLNIGAKESANEHEFLLPAYALNRDGKLVMAHYDIVKEMAKREFGSAQYDPEHEIEYIYHFEHESYVVAPSAELMTWENSKIKDFDAYERRYRTLVCSPSNLADPRFEYLRDMCFAVQAKGLESSPAQPWLWHK